MTKMTISGSRLDAREVVVVADGGNDENDHLQLAFEREGGGVVAGDRNGRRNHLQLAFGCEGGGGGGSHFETTKKASDSSRLEVREGAVVAEALEERKKTSSGSHLNASEVVGGGKRIETTKTTTSGSHLDAREVVVVGVVLKRQKEPPPAHVWA